MSAMQSEVDEAFRAIAIPEDKALKAAAALSKGPHGNKCYEIAGAPRGPKPKISSTYFRGSPKRDDDVSSIKPELNSIRWMMGFVLAFQAATFTKLFLH